MEWWNVILVKLKTLNLRFWNKNNNKYEILKLKIKFWFRKHVDTCPKNRNDMTIEIWCRKFRLQRFEKISLKFHDDVDWNELTDWNLHTEWNHWPFANLQKCDCNQICGIQLIKIKMEIKMTTNYRRNWNINNLHLKSVVKLSIYTTSLRVVRTMTTN